MIGTQQKIRDQTIDKTMAKPAGVVRNQEKPHNLKMGSVLSLPAAAPQGKWGGGLFAP